MARFKPIHGIIVVAVLIGLTVVSDVALEGGFRGSSFIRVGPDAAGNVVINVANLKRGQVKFYRFLNPGNQEVKFFVGRDHTGALQVAFDANEICAKRKRGFHQDGTWMVCNVCDRSTKLSEVNKGLGGCSPVPLRFTVNGNQLVLTSQDILQGWHFFA